MLGGRAVAAAGAIALVLGLVGACSSSSAPIVLSPLSSSAAPSQPSSATPPSSDPGSGTATASGSVTTTTGPSASASSAGPASTVDVPSTGTAGSTTSTTATTSTTKSRTTTTSYSTTVYIPPSAETVHPSDHSPPAMQLPKSAKAHDPQGASAFAAWYFRWILYAYVAHSTDQLSRYSSKCAQCNELVNNVRQAIKSDQRFHGTLPAATAVHASLHDNTTAQVVVKWASAGYSILGRDGSVISKHSGGEGYYAFNLVWESTGWVTRQIVTVHE